MPGLTSKKEKNDGEKKTYSYIEDDGNLCIV
jgi:hypothetical protein